MSWFSVSSLKPAELRVVDEVLASRVVFEAEWLVAEYEATQGES